MVRAFGSHLCGPGSIPGFCVICGVILLLLYYDSIDFCAVSPGSNPALSIFDIKLIKSIVTLKQISCRKRQTQFLALWNSLFFFRFRA